MTTTPLAETTPKEPRIIIGVPSYDGSINNRMAARLLEAGERYPFTVNFNQTSLLAYTFNRLWVDALNSRANGWTHFCMLHADIIPEPHWLDKMVDLMISTGADVLSVIQPIKNILGTTSTALESGDPWKPNRFTLKQIHKMEPTFSDPRLLVNTGLMLVDMRAPWVEKIRFHIDDLISRGKDGKFVVDCMPEDWNFSRDAKALGATLYATRAVKCIHVGMWEYVNSEPWGLWETDRVYGEAKL